MPASENSFMYSGLLLCFKDLFNHEKVLEVLVTRLSQNFRVYETISEFKGSNVELFSS